MKPEVIKIKIDLDHPISELKEVVNALNELITNLEAIDEKYKKEENE